MTASHAGRPVTVMRCPHTGCARFVQRYGADVSRFVNPDEGRSLRLRGLNGTGLTADAVRPGDSVRVLSRAEPPIRWPSRDRGVTR